MAEAACLSRNEILPKATAEGTFNPEGTQLNELMYEVKMY
jgi:hypothetical protein